jgi:hypothetical protein
MKNILFILGAIFLLIGLGWDLYLFIENFDKLLTSRQKFEIYGKPAILVAIGAILYNIWKVKK